MAEQVVLPFTAGVVSDVDTLATLLLAASVVLVVRYLLSVYQPKGLSDKVLPPLVSGNIPYFGVWFQLKRDPVGFIKQCMETYGHTFTLYICGRRYHILTRTEDQGLFYLSPDSEVSAEGSPFAAVLGDTDTSLFKGQPPDKVFADVAKWLGIFHRHVATGLQGSYLRTYVPYVKQDVLTYYNGLKDKGEVNIMHLIIDISISANLRMMLGTEYMDQHGKEVHNKFLVVKNFFETHAPNPFMRNVVLHIPTPENIAVRNAIRDVKQNFMDYVLELYDRGEEEKILFSCLKQSRVEEITEGPPRGITIVMMILLLTSTANAPLTAFWVLAELIKEENKEHLKLIREEQCKVHEEMRAEGRDPANPEHWLRSDLEKMEYMDLCILESIRMYQGLVHAGNVLRGLRVDKQINGYTLPKGDLLAIPSLRYMDENVFPEPKKFIPKRWADPVMQQRVRTERFLFSPFGVGRHHCPGKGFARVFVKAIVGDLLHMCDVQVSPTSSIVEDHPPFTGINPPKLGDEYNIINYQRREL